MSKVYEKPQMKFVSLQNSEKIAAKCWSGGEITKYFDIQGPGYVEVMQGSGSCDSNNSLIFTYYDANGENPEKIMPGNPKYDQIKGEVKGGNQFTLTDDFADSPDSRWS